MNCAYCGGSHLAGGLSCPGCGAPRPDWRADYPAYRATTDSANASAAGFYRWQQEQAQMLDRAFMYGDLRRADIRFCYCPRPQYFHASQSFRGRARHYRLTECETCGGYY